MTALLSVVCTSAWADVYQIGSAADLKAFADRVNNGTEPGADAVLTADIDYTAYTTGFIGRNETGKHYTGTFDGQGHTVTTNIVNTARWTGLVGWLSVGMNISNCIVAIAESTSKYNLGWANPAPSPTNSYMVAPTDTRLASGELCYLLNGDQSDIGWHQALGTDDCPSPFGTLTVGRGQWLSSDYLYYNIDGSGNITIPQLNLSENDTKYDVPANVTAKSISITRDIPAGQWIGLCLPFDYDIPSGWDVRELAYVNGTGDGATSINEELRMKNDESEAAIYNLAGQRLNKAQNQRSTYVKGINIVNGKKILF